MKKAILILLIFLSVSLFATQMQKIKIYTEHYPPHNMKSKDGSLTGSSVEVLAAVLQEMNSSQTIKDVKLESWSRSYTVAQKVKNAMVFSTTRTKSREPLFKWVGPIAKATVGVIALKTKKIKIDKISDFSKYKTGAVLEDVGETLLLDRGVDKKHIHYVKGKDAINIAFNMLKKGRIDMFSYNLEVAFANAKLKGFDMDKYEMVYVLKTGELYFAFNKKTDDKVTKEWQDALDAIKKDGIYEKIHASYR